MNVDVVTLKGKEYIEIDKITTAECTYVYLTPLDEDDNDFAVRRLTLEDGKYYYDPVINRKDFDKAIHEFYHKHKSLEKYLNKKD